MVALELPRALMYRHLALRVVRAMLRPLGRPPDQVDAVVSALGEAFNNAVLHAGEPRGGAASDTEDSVDIEVEVAARSVEIRVLDQGAGFSLAEVPAPAMERTCIDDLPEGGMGLYIIRRLMSEVSYERGQPNLLRMRMQW